MTPEGVDPFLADGVEEPTAPVSPSEDGSPRSEPEGGTPVSGAEDGQGQAARPDGQGNELKPQDFGAFENWEDAKAAFGEKKEDAEPGELGENADPKELAKSYAHLRTRWTQDTQRIADLERQIAQFQQQTATPPARALPEPTPLTPEKRQEIEDLWVSNPSKAMQETLKTSPELVQEMLAGIPGFDRLMRVADRVEADEIVGHLSRTHKDFQTYEPQIMAEMQKMGDYADYVAGVPDGKGIELLYRAVRAETIVKNVLEKVGRVQSANAAAQKQNQNLANLGPVGGGLPAANGQKVNVPGLGEFDASDLSWVDPQVLRRL